MKQMFKKYRKGCVVALGLLTVMLSNVDINAMEMQRAKINIDIDIPMSSTNKEIKQMLDHIHKQLMKTIEEHNQKLQSSSEVIRNSAYDREVIETSIFTNEEGNSIFKETSNEVYETQGRNEDAYKEEQPSVTVLPNKQGVFIFPNQIHLYEEPSNPSFDRTIKQINRIL